MKALEEFIDALVVEEIEVIRIPQLLLLCGGPCSAQFSKTHSLRNYFMCLTADKYADITYYPEQFKDWLADAVYNNLIEFETDFAAMASAVIVFVESAGSIAEFGVFSQISEIAQKMLVVIDNDENAKDSFIKLGPVRYMKKNYHEDSVSVYNMLITSDEDRDSKYEQQAEDLITDIENIMKKNSLKNKKFINDSKCHIFLFTFELIMYFSALKFSEILTALKKIKISIINDELKQLLFLMEKLKFIEKAFYGNDTFYIRNVNNVDSNPFIKFQFNKSFKEKNGYIDRSRFILSTISDYKENEKRRFKAMFLRKVS